MQYAMGGCLYRAIMEHVEEAGIHSGDSACIIPPLTISDRLQEEIKNTTKALALELNVIGLLNIQYAIKDETLYVIEVNPRASRTVPFVSKTIGISLPKIAVKVMLGAKLKDLGLIEMKRIPYVSVKEAVLPFNKFPGVDILLSPEMRSTVRSWAYPWILESHILRLNLQRETDCL